MASANLADSQARTDTQAACAVGEQTTGRQPRADAQTSPAAGEGPGRVATDLSVPNIATLLDPALALAADVVDDLERVRIANENRLRQLTRSEQDSDGETRGFGLDESHPDVARLAAIVHMLAQVEKDATKNLEKVMRRHPLHAWAKAQRGVGDKQIARLLAAIGDPYIRPEIVREDDSVIPAGPRTVSALWAYAGLHVLPVSGQGSLGTHTGTAADGDQLPADQGAGATQKRAVGGSGGDPGQTTFDAQVCLAGVAPRRQRGVRPNWSPKARMRAWNLAESCKKQLVKPCTGVSPDSLAVHVEGCACGAYRLVYDDGRAKYRDSLHVAECLRCGPSGKSAQPGSPLSAAHKEARALRLVMKAILRDLWREAKRIHDEAGEAL